MNDLKPLKITYDATASDYIDLLRRVGADQIAYDVVKREISFILMGEHHEIELGEQGTGTIGMFCLALERAGFETHLDDGHRYATIIPDLSSPSWFSLSHPDSNIQVMDLRRDRLLRLVSGSVFKGL